MSKQVIFKMRPKPREPKRIKMKTRKYPVEYGTTLGQVIDYFREQGVDYRSAQYDRYYRSFMIRSPETDLEYAKKVKKHCERVEAWNKWCEKNKVPVEKELARKEKIAKLKEEKKRMIKEIDDKIKELEKNKTKVPAPSKKGKSRKAARKKSPRKKKTSPPVHSRTFVF